MLVRAVPLRRYTPLRRTSKTNKKRPGWEPKYLAWIRTLPCAICGSTSGVEAAHTRVFGMKGMAQKAPDRGAIPLCHCCHRTNDDSYHALTPEWRWADYHGLELRYLVDRLNNCYELIRSAKGKQLCIETQLQYAV